jgi:hypothetical protein
MTFEEFKARLAQAGYAPAEKSLQEMYAALPHLEAMRARVHKRFTYAEEPAHVFAAEVGQ